MTHRTVRRLPYRSPWPRLRFEPLEDRDVPNVALVADLNATANGTEMSRLRYDFDGRMLFHANDGVTGYQLHAADAKGVQRVSTFAPPPTTTSLDASGPSGVVHGGKFYFSQNTFGLYRYDGGSAAPVLIDPLISGGGDTGGTKFVSVGDRFFFLAQATSNNLTSGTNYGNELWVSDGTEPGTKLLLGDFTPGSSGTSVNALRGSPDGQTLFATLFVGGAWQVFAYSLAAQTLTNLTSVTNPVGQVDSFVHFAGATWFVFNNSLYRSDGTAAGTEVVGQTNRGVEVVGDRLYFRDFATETVRRTDGAAVEAILHPADGTPLRADIFNPGWRYVLGTTLYLTAFRNNGTFDRELYAVTPESVTATLVADINPASASTPHSMAGDGTRFYFWATPAGSNDHHPYAFDGTTLTPLGDITPGGNTSLSNTRTRVHNGQFYTAFQTAGAWQFWHFTPSAGSGTKLTPPGGGTLTFHASDTFHARPEGLYFAADDGARGMELWRAVDGAVALAAEINVTTQNTNATAVAAVDDRLILLATKPGLGYEYYATDGTTITSLGDLTPGPGGTEPAYQSAPAVAGGFYYFSNGTTLFKTDGTPVGTAAVAVPGATVTRVLGAIGGDVFFAASTAATGDELWRHSNGTAAPVAEIRPGTAGSAPTFVGTDGGRIYFTANDGVSGLELWAVDAAATPTLLADLNPGITDSYIPAFTGKAGTDRYYFFANSRVGYTDGTPAGTKLVTAAKTISTNPNSFAVAGNTLYFRGTDSAQGTELWATDGTTVTLASTGLAPGTAGISAGPQVAAGSRVYFTAFFTGVGYKLYTLEGGTPLLLKDYSAAGISSPPSDLYGLPDGRLVFSAATPDTGREIWFSDGTPGGTKAIADVNPGPANGFIANRAIVPFKGHLYYTGDNLVSGAELFRADPPSPPTDLALSNATLLESSPAGTVVGTLVPADINTIESFTFAIVPGGADTAKFALAGSTLVATDVFDYENQQTATVRVRVTDSAGYTFEKTLTVAIVDVVGNEPPVGVSLTPATLAENAAAGTTVGTLAGIDQPGDTHTFALVSGIGDADNAKFTVSGTTLKAAAAFNFEDQATATVRIRATDQSGLWNEFPVTITITDANEAPTGLTLSAAVVSEAATPGTVVGTLAGVDPDAGATLTFLNHGDDGGRFEVVGNTVVVADHRWLDFETATNHSITVRVVDQGGLGFTTNFLITVTDAAEPGLANVSEPRAFANVFGTIYHVAGSGANTKLYRSIGTAAPSVVHTFATPADAPLVAATDNKLFFVDGAKLYVLGNAGGPTLRHTFATPIREMVSWPRDTPDDNVALIAQDRVWRVDAFEVTDFTLNGSLAYTPADLLARGSNVYFTAAAPGTGRELRRIQGSGTLSTPNDVRFGPASSRPRNFGDSLYTATTNSAGIEPVSLDGLEYDLNPGPASSDPSADVLGFLVATTAAGRRIVNVSNQKAYDLGPGVTDPALLFNNGHLYAAGTTAAAGRELFSIAYQTSGAVTLHDLNPGPASSDPRAFVMTTHGTHFTAVNAQGRELWRASGATVELALDAIPGAASGLAADTAFAYDDVFGQLYFPAAGQFTVFQAGPAHTLSLSGSGMLLEGINYAITLSLDRYYDRPFTVQLGFGGSAEIPTHYNPDQFVTFAANSKTAYAFLNIVNDTVDIIDRTTVISVASVSRPGYNVVAPTVTFQIIDDENPVPTFDAPASAVEEWAGEVHIPFTLSAPTLEDVTFFAQPIGWLENQFTIIHDVTVLAGQSKGFVRVQVIDDIIPENAETFPIQLLWRQNALPALTTHQFTIKGAPLITVPAPVQVSEAAGPQTYTLTMDRVLDRDVTFWMEPNYGAVTSADLKINGAAPVPLYQLTIPSGSTTATFTVTPSNDTVDEVDEGMGFKFHTATPEAGFLGNGGNFHLTIVDDDGPTVSFAAAAATRGELGGIYDLEVTLSAPSPQTVSVPLLHTGGTAVFGSDFVWTDWPSLPHTLVFLPGQTSLPFPFRVTVFDDGLHEADETVTFALGAATNGVASPAGHTLTIVSAPRPEVALGYDATVLETGGTATVTAAFTFARVVDVTIPFTLTGTAASGDFTVSAGNFFFPAGKASASVTFTVVDDALDEANETIVLTLGTPTPEEVLLGGTTQVTITIVDDDGPAVSFQTPAATVPEHAAATYAATLVLSQPSPQDVTVTLGYLGGSATSGSDFTSGAGTVVIPAGKTTFPVPIGILDDWLEEADETVQFTITGATNADVGAAATHTLTLTGVEPARIQIGNPFFSLAEPAGTATFHVVLSKALPVDLTVPLIIGGTASAFDYTISATSAVFPAGSTKASITVVVVDDGIHEGTDQVAVTLGVPDSLLASSFQGGEAKVQIADNDEVPKVRIVNSSATTDEGGSVTLTFQLTTASYKTVRAVYEVGGTVSFSEYSVTTSYGSSFSFGSGLNIFFAPGETTATATFATNPDATPEANETITLVGDFLENADWVVASMNATVLVVDDDRPTINFETLNLTVPEGGTAKTITARLTHVVNGVSVPYLTPIAISVPVISNGATQGAEYVLSGSQFSFAAGSSSATVTITSPDNATPERTKHVTLTLLPPGNVNPGSTMSMTATLTDDDKPTVGVSNLVILESGGAKSLVVTLTPPHVTDVRVRVQVLTPADASVAAIPGDDFTTGATEFVIPAGASQGFWTITPINDGLLEREQETITLSLTATEDVTGGVTFPTVAQTVILQDNETEASILLLPDDGSTLAEGASVSGYVSLKNAAPYAMSIPLTVIGNNGGSAEDVTIPASISFAAGATVGLFTISAKTDGVLEGVHSLSIGFGPLPGNVFVSASKGTLPLTITDTFTASFVLTAGTVAEGKFFTATIALSGPAPADVTIPFSTSGDFTRYFPTDPYQPTVHDGYVHYSVGSAYVHSNSIVIPAGQQFGVLTIQPFQEPVPFAENDETLTLTLGTPSLAGVGLGNRTFSVTVVNAPLGGPPGSVTQGLLAGTTVFLDANHNGVRDFVDLDLDGHQDEGEPLEPVSVTNYAGRFELPYLKAADTNNDNTHTFNEGAYVAIGGTDLSTNAPLEVPLIAPPGAIVTSLSSVAARLMRRNSWTLAEARSRLQEAFDLAGIDFLATHGVTGTLAGDTAAIAVKKAGSRLQTTTVHIAKVVSNLPGGPSMETAAFAVYDDLAARLTAVGTTFDPTLEGNVRAVLASVAARFGLAPSADLLDGTVAVTAAVNTAVDDVPLAGSSEAYLGALAKLQTVAQVTAANDLARAARGEVAIATVVAAYAGTNLAAAVTAAVTGDVINPQLHIFPGSVVEGNDGERMLEFHVLLDRPSKQGVTVAWETFDSTATAGSDYIAVSGTLTWAPNQGNAQTVWIRVTGDTATEYDESVGLLLSNPVRATLAAGSGFGTIVADDVFDYTPPDDGVASTLRFRAEPGRVYLSRNELPVWDGPLSDGVPIVIHGRDGRDDTLTVDAESGWLGAITFHGGTGSDSLIANDGYLGASAVPGPLAYATGESIAVTGVESVVSVQRGVVLPQPAVTALTINGGAASRSRVTRIDLDFTAAVTPTGLGAISVIRTGGVTLTAANGLIVTATSPTRVTLTFANVDSPELDYGSLADGNWQVSLPGLGYTSPVGSVRRLFGDTNGDGTVDGATDFTTFMFVTAVDNPFDFNNDGTVDGGTDFAEFGVRFGRTL